ncbi:MAG TPA: 30S ribosomal protein S16 [Candidatus Moranbacteria bacterium]|nr:30S ribosomal protein S16 [Candidatus Moranbacteria bacterium]HRZ33350.1 30S ribosomal protein S16 [Candidatus Moranbacteria bacterium]
MLAIRFERVGRKNKAQFRIVLQEHTVAPGGRHVAVLGNYDPHQKKAVFKAEKIKEWIAKGAQVSDSVYNLFIREGVIEGKKRSIKMEKPKTKEIPAEPVEEEAKTEEPKVEETKSENPVAEIKEEIKTEEPKVETVKEIIAEIKEEVKPEEPKIEEAVK